VSVVAGLALLAAGCGGDDESSDPADASVAVSTAAPAPLPSTSGPAATATSVSEAATVDTGDIPLPVGTGDIPLPVGTGDIPLPPVTADVPYPLSVTVGIDSNPERIERVPLGATVTITVTNPGDDDEFHLHGFDLGDGQVIPAGQPASFTFVADQVGSFELESHETGDVLMILEVV
jgi:hypothetical protein